MSREGFIVNYFILNKKIAEIKPPYFTDFTNIDIIKNVRVW